MFTGIRHLDSRKENVAPLDKSYSFVTHGAYRKLAFSTLTYDTLGIIPLAASVVTTLRTSAKNSVRELIDYTTLSPTVLAKLLYFHGPFGLAKYLTHKVVYNFIWRLSSMWSHIFWYKCFGIFSRLLLRGRRSWQVPTKFGYLFVNLHVLICQDISILTATSLRISGLISTCYIPQLNFLRHLFASGLRIDFMFLGVAEKLRNAIIIFVTFDCPSIRSPARPHQTTWLPVDGISRNLTF